MLYCTLTTGYLLAEVYNKFAFGDCFRFHDPFKFFCTLNANQFLDSLRLLSLVMGGVVKTKLFLLVGVSRVSYSTTSLHTHTERHTRVHKCYAFFLPLPPCHHLHNMPEFI